MVSEAPVHEVPPVVERSTESKAVESLAATQSFVDPHEIAEKESATDGNPIDC
jgi:hypothetical protein